MLVSNYSVIGYTAYTPRLYTHFTGVKRIFICGMMGDLRGKGVGSGITAPGSGITSHGIGIRQNLSRFWSQGSEIWAQKWDQR